MVGIQLSLSAWPGDWGILYHKIFWSTHHCKLLWCTHGSDTKAKKVTLCDFLFLATNIAHLALALGLSPPLFMKDL